MLFKDFFPVLSSLKSVLDCIPLNSTTLIIENTDSERKLSEKNDCNIFYNICEFSFKSLFFLQMKNINIRVNI